MLSLQARVRMVCPLRGQRRVPVGCNGTAHKIPTVTYLGCVPIEFRVLKHFLGPYSPQILVDRKNLDARACKFEVCTTDLNYAGPEGEVSSPQWE